MKQLLRASLFSLLVAVCLSRQLETSTGLPPHIYIFFVDDLGHNDLGFRDDTISTPYIDSLVEEGYLFTNSYSTPACTPSRAALMTGRYPHSIAMQHGSIEDDQACCLGLDYDIMSNYLQDYAYAGHCFGKWHLGFCREECTPTGRGFISLHGGLSFEDEQYNHTTLSDGWADWFDDADVDRVANNYHTQDLLVRGANGIWAVYANWTGPVFLYIAIEFPHTPLQPKEEQLELYDDLDATEERKKYLGLVSGMDYVVQEVVEYLKQIDKYNDTIILFSTDNGGDVNQGNNAPYRGGKSSLWEGGTKVNTFLHSHLLPEKNVEIDGLVHVTDWLPTILSFAGAPIPDGLDGYDLSDWILDGGDSPRSEMIYLMDREYQYGGPINGEMAVRDERYKLIWGNPGIMDGVGLDEAQFIYNMEEYQDFVAENGRSKRKAYNITDEQEDTYNSFMEIVQVSDEDFDAGTGYMLMFDLQEDPTETTDISDSDDADVIAAKENLIQILQDAYNNDYLGQTDQCNEANDLWDPSLYGQDKATGGLYDHWCDDIFPADD